MSPRRRLIAVLLATSAGALGVSGDAAREEGLNDLQALGVDAVHSIVFWAKVAPPSDFPPTAEGLRRVRSGQLPARAL